MFLGLGLSLAALRPVATAPSVDAAATAYSAAMTTPLTSGRLALVSDLVVALKAASAWTPLDWLCLLAQETAQGGRVNLRNPAKILSAVNSPIFTADRGFAGDGATSYLDFGERFDAAGNGFALNSATLGAWCNQQGASIGSKPHIGQAASPARAIINAHGGSSTVSVRINDSTNTPLDQGAFSRLGHRTAIRTDASTKRLFMGGGAAQASNVASATGNTSNGRTLAEAATFTDDRLAVVYSGGALTDAQRAALHSALSTYLAAIGAE